MSTPKIKPQKPHKHRKAAIIILSIVNCVIVLALACMVLFLYMTHGLKHTDLRGYDLGVVEPSETADEPGIISPRGTVDNRSRALVKNIAFFGVDSTYAQAAIGDRYRSDSIIIVSLTEGKNVAKLTSILRDSKVPIEGHDPQKINAAYAYGYAPLAIKTLNQNFKLNITDYVTIDFAGLESLIDILGGVEVEITQEESQALGLSVGRNSLNGKQALSYSRLRRIDSDYYRASRQQTVFAAVVEKLKTYSAFEYPGLIRELLSCVETSLTYEEILRYIKWIDLKTADLVMNTIPDYDYEEGLWGGIDETGSWVWIYDIDAAAERLHDIIYG